MVLREHLKRRGNPRSQLVCHKNHLALYGALYFVPGLAARAHGTRLDTRGRQLMAVSGALAKPEGFALSGYLCVRST